LVGVEAAMMVVYLAGWMGSRLVAVLVVSMVKEWAVPMVEMMAQLPVATRVYYLAVDWASGLVV
jgi:hypothetical protein